jgi:TRAP-type mannitol/chloroaromatic compound transport system substrate-binding protein
LTECEVNKKAWDRIGERNQKLVQIAGKMTTYKFYQQIGHDDTSAYEFYKKSGNEIIVLDEAVIKKGDELSQAWADKVAAKQGGWFAKVLANQRAYKKAWGNAYKYRDSLPPK